jgi:hypothetical protein
VFPVNRRATVAPALGGLLMRHLFAVCAAALLWSATAFADPVGRYAVEGTNPGGGSQYTGTVTVEKIGQTYRVIWVVGSTRYVDIGDHDFIAASYKSGNDSGLSLYDADGDNWSGVWAYAGVRQMGTEVWKRE